MGAVMEQKGEEVTKGVRLDPEGQAAKGIVIL